MSSRYWAWKLVYTLIFYIKYKNIILDKKRFWYFNVIQHCEGYFNVEIKVHFHSRNTAHAYKVHTTRHSAPRSMATNVFFQFSHLKNVGSIIALAAGCAERLEFTGNRRSPIFVGISFPPQDRRGRVLHSVRSILLLSSCQPGGACVRALRTNVPAC